ncbi:MAG: hypothetical protein PVF51_08940 [Nitrospirota bacterium]|jgi:hypothetical protein
MSHTLFRTLSAATFAALLSALAPMHAIAQTEDVCASETGAAYGLCTAYCEAMDCDGVEPNANETACGKVYDNFVDRTGYAPPCAVPPVICPCDGIAAWDDVIDGTTPITNCLTASDGVLEATQTTNNYPVFSGRCIDSDCNPRQGSDSVPLDGENVCGVVVFSGAGTTALGFAITPEEADACTAALARQCL